MASTLIKSPETLADLVRRLGDIPLTRIRMQPLPGTATERDLVRFNERKLGLCELVDGVLVEKPVGNVESVLTMFLGEYLGVFLRESGLGYLTGPDGGTRFARGLVRLPDLAVVRWDSLPERRVPDKAIGIVVPDLVVEVLSRSNTKKEINRKLGEYFSAGVQLAWIIDPRKRTVCVHHSENKSSLLGVEDALNGGDVLPGFTLPIRTLYQRMGWE